MRFYLIIIPCIVFVECNNTSREDAVSQADILKPPPENSIRHIIKLADSLGDVSITLPVRYDTNFTWTHKSDCGKPCDIIKYRFQSKSLPIWQESGWMWEVPMDSIEQFTIEHSGDFPFHNFTDSTFIYKLNKHQRELICDGHPISKVKVDTTTEKIGDRYFSMVTATIYDTAKSQCSKKVWGATTLLGNLIKFKFELLTKERDSLKENFTENAKYYLRTIRLSKGM